eukprot:jgi/Botrbrau1/4253/Bobra.0044s0048.1
MLTLSGWKEGRLHGSFDANGFIVITSSTDRKTITLNQRHCHRKLIIDEIGRTGERKCRPTSRSTRVEVSTEIDII